jgi:hypothetical protein
MTPNVRLALAIALLTGCRAKEEAPPPPFVPPPVLSAAPAVDQARPGELAEGPDSAFGLPVPRRMVIKARFPDAVFATGQVSLEALGNYVRERVVAAHVDTGPAKTVFTGVSVKSSPQRLVRIEVATQGGETELVVRDQTKPPAKDGLSEEERWKELGLDPRGQPLDPTHLE